MAARLTDKQRKKIIADYIESGNYRATARKNKVATDTVKRIVLKDTTVVQKATEKREENTLDMLEYMESRKKQAQGIIDLYLAALADPTKLELATLSQIATALGIVTDKFIKTAEAHSDKPGIMDKIVEAVKNIE